MSSNVARWKTASQSSDGGGVALKAIDGNNNGFYNDLTCSRTEPGALSWWSVDLGFLHLVTSVVIFSRADCCGMGICVSAKLHVVSLGNPQLPERILLSGDKI